MNEANIEVKLDKFKFAADTIELVGYELSQQSLEPINSKGKGISERTIEAHKPKGFYVIPGALTHCNKFIPSLAKECLVPEHYMRRITFGIGKRNTRRLSNK